MRKLNKSTLAEIEESFKSQMRQDALNLAKANTHVVKCPKCGSEIVVTVGSNICQFCGAEISFDIDLD